MKFEEFKLSKKLQEAIKKLGIDKPTKIQEGAIPKVLEGRDLIGESATGSGKTLVFGCGIVEKVEPGKGLQSLILTPTRELADQVKDMLLKLSEGKNLNIIAVYGGVSLKPQFYGLTKADVVVATPGRFMDHLKRGTVDTSKIKILVLDEADRMFDMGFIDDVNQIIKACPNRNQTLFFSATISPRVKELASRYTKNPVEVLAANKVDPSKLKQEYYDVERNLKLSLLIHLLQKEKSGLIMVFCNTRNTTDFVVKNLRAQKIDAIAIHGGFSQNKRTDTMESFNRGKVGVLVCTDVAARGLHIDNVSHVYNFNIPNEPKDYVHRIGRTARAGKDGKVINLLCDFDYDNFSRVLNEYREFSIIKLKVPQIRRIAMIKVEKGRNNHYGRKSSSYNNRGNGRRRNYPRDHKRREHL